MSEHDEPKTALTRLQERLAGEFTRTLYLGSHDAKSAAWYGNALAQIAADALLADGYTTSPAPEATETIEWEYGVDYTHMVSTRASNGWTAGYTSRAHADQIAAERLDGKVFRRRAAGPWVPVARAADEHEEGP